MTDIATCGSCGLSWDDSLITQLTPAPSGRCPFEYYHEYEETRFVLLRVDFPEETSDHYATKLADQLVEFANALGDTTIVDEGVRSDSLPLDPDVIPAGFEVQPL